MVVSSCFSVATSYFWRFGEVRTTSLGRDHSLWSDVFSGNYPKHHVLKFDGWPVRNKYGVWPICYCIYEVGIKSCMDLRERCFDSGLIPIPGPLSHVIPCAAGWCSRDRPCRRHSTVVACCLVRTCLCQDPLSLRILWHTPPQQNRLLCSGCCRVFKNCGSSELDSALSSMFDFQTSCSKCTALWCIVHGACYGAHVDMALCQLNRGLWFERDHRLSQQLWLKNCWVLSSLKRFWEEAVDVLMYLNLWQVQRWFFVFFGFFVSPEKSVQNSSQPMENTKKTPKISSCRAVRHP